MNSTQIFQELISLLRLHLLQEYSIKEAIWSSPQNYLFFKEVISVPPTVLPTPPPVTPTKISTISQPPVKKPQIIPAKIEQPAQIKFSPSEPKKQITEEQTQSPPPTFFTLDPPLYPESESFHDIRKLMQTQFPEYVILEYPPDDAEAKAIANSWKTAQTPPEVVILISSPSQLELGFLKNLAKALEVYGIKLPAIINADQLDHDQGWEKLFQNPKLRLILSSQAIINSRSELIHSYREVLENSNRYLKHVSLIILSDLSLYLKEPTLKPSLWKELCKVLLL